MKRKTQAERKAEEDKIMISFVVSKSVLRLIVDALRSYEMDLFFDGREYQEKVNTVESSRTKKYYQSRVLETQLNGHLCQCLRKSFIKDLK